MESEETSEENINQRPRFDTNFAEVEDEEIENKEPENQEVENQEMQEMEVVEEENQEPQEELFEQDLGLTISL